MTEGGLRVVRPADRRIDAASGAMRREAAISLGTVGAERIWFGHVVLPPGMVSAVHHHGEAESGIFIVSGRARFLCGERLEEVHDAEPGDFIWVPPHVVHVELNPDEGEPVVMAVARSTQETLVFNVDPPAGWEPPVQM